MGHWRLLRHGKKYEFQVSKAEVEFFLTCVVLYCSLHSACWRNFLLSVLETETINNVTTNELLLQNE